MTSTRPPTFTPSSRMLPLLLAARTWALAMLVGSHVSVALPQTQTPFRIHPWQPMSSHLTLQTAAAPSSLALKPHQTAPSSALICLSNANTGQTLVPIQPTEGGETRFITLGGQAPTCQPVGPAWARAPTGEAPWYKTLFAQLGAQSASARITASTSGATRGGSGNARPEFRPDPCGLYPSASGLVHIASGFSALALGTKLPEGARASLIRLSAYETPFTTEVTQGRLHWPVMEWIAGDRWRIEAQTRATGQASASSEDRAVCDLTIVVQPHGANPIHAVSRHAPRFAADPGTVQATLVAAQLDDPNLAAWHAWLLASLAPPFPPSSQDMRATLWNAWWTRHSVSPP